jgi:4-amino-4-deoxy-L-arabinose transferase-like glycosyltransferase
MGISFAALAPRPDSIADWLRFVAVIEFLLVAGWAVVIAIVAANFRPPPWYVRLIASSYIALAAGWALTMRDRIGEPFGWRVVLALVAGTLGIAAMVGLTHHYRPEARRRRHEQVTTDAIARMNADLERRKREG